VAQLIDISVFVARERQGGSLSFLVEALPNEPIALASITASELLIRIYRANSPDRRSRREAFGQAILAHVPVIPFDLRIARTHTRLSAELASGGQPTARVT
jgi:tRNA(fMet)-specific endonuclease VapC